MQAINFTGENFYSSWQNTRTRLFFISKCSNTFVQKHNSELVRLMSSSLRVDLAFKTQGHQPGPRQWDNTQVHVCPLESAIYAFFCARDKKWHNCPDGAHNMSDTALWFHFACFCKGTLAAVWRLHEADDVGAHGASFHGCFFARIKVSCCFEKLL